MRFIRISPNGLVAPGQFKGQDDPRPGPRTAWRRLVIFAAATGNRRILRSMATDDQESLAPIELPIDGVLDLHTFAPADVKELVVDYVEECARRGIQQVRIIHGKGQGVLRRIVHGVLQRHPRVHGYVLADPSGGGWGATVVQLRT